MHHYIINTFDKQREIKLSCLMSKLRGSNRRRYCGYVM